MTTKHIVWLIIATLLIAKGGVLLLNPFTIAGLVIFSRLAYLTYPYFFGDAK